MPIGRYLGAALSLCALVPAAAAQQVPPSAKSGGPDIVVEAVADTPSAWRRAESAHVIVTSKGSEAELKRVTNNLERLYALMSRLYHRAATPDDTVKLQVILVDSADFFHAMNLKNVRSEEGPYAATFAGQRYYDPREDGPMLAVARTDQHIKLATALAEDRDMADAEEGGGDPESGAGGATFMTTAARPPIARTWEAVLYSAFAQHFLLTYLPAAYPRWYLDGVGALFSTMNVRRDGKVDYALEPLNYRQIFRSYGRLNVREIFTGQYLDAAPDQVHWTPYHAWLLTHYFLFSKLNPERSLQFQRYMAAIQHGTPMAAAASVFGDLKRLQDDIDIYEEKGTEYARTDPIPTPGGDPLINPLTRSSAAVIEARLELGSRLAGVNADAVSTQATGWLAALHETVRRLPYNADAILIDAEASCRGAQYDACLDAADRVLTKAPDSVRALAWKGVALTHQALAVPAAQRASALAGARVPIMRAIRLDGETPLPLIAYFQSYAQAGEPVPEQALRGLVKATQMVPAAPAPRLYLAQELVRQGHADLARLVLNPVLYGGYDSPEKVAAQGLLGASEGTPSSR